MTPTTTGTTAETDPQVETTRYATTRYTLGNDPTDDKDSQDHTGQIQFQPTANTAKQNNFNTNLPLVQSSEYK